MKLRKYFKDDKRNTEKSYNKMYSLGNHYCFPGAGRLFHITAKLNTFIVKENQLNYS